MNSLFPATGRNAKWDFVLWPLFFLMAARICSAAESGIALTNGNFSATVNPITLEVTFQKPGIEPVLISAAQTNLGSIGDLETTPTNVSWSLTDRDICVNVELQSDGLSVHLQAENPGEITFPILPGSDPVKGWILPMFEGVYAPCADAQWTTFLTNSGDLNTTADLTLPLLGLDCGDYTLNCIITNAFNNQLRFVPTPDGRLRAAVTHQFTRNHPVKECGFFFQ